MTCSCLALLPVATFDYQAAVFALATICGSALPGSGRRLGKRLFTCLPPLPNDDCFSWPAGREGGSLAHTVTAIIWFSFKKHTRRLNISKLRPLCCCRICMIIHGCISCPQSKHRIMGAEVRELGVRKALQALTGWRWEQLLQRVRVHNVLAQGGVQHVPHRLQHLCHKCLTLLWNLRISIPAATGSCSQSLSIMILSLPAMQSEPQLCCPTAGSSLTRAWMDSWCSNAAESPADDSSYETWKGHVLSNFLCQAPETTCR